MRRAQSRQKSGRIGHVFDHFHVQNHIEGGFAGGEQSLGRGVAIVDLELHPRGVRPGHGDVFSRGVDPGRLEAQTRHRLAEQAPAAADIDQAQAVERRARPTVSPEALQALVADERQANRIEPVQWGEGAVRVPPGLGESREPGDLAWVDAGPGRGGGGHRAVLADLAATVNGPDGARLVVCAQPSG